MTYYYFIAYFLIVGIFYLMTFIVVTNEYYLYLLVISCIVTFILSAFYIDEFLALLHFNQVYKGKGDKPLTFHYRHPLSLALALALVLAYALAGQPFYLSFVIAMLVNGAALKLFKITSLKMGTILLGFAYLYDLLYYVLINYFTNINYEQYTLQYLNFPWLFEIPLFQDTYLRVCNQISFLNQVMPGLTMCYLVRYDQNYQTRMYTTIR